LVGGLIVSNGDVPIMAGRYLARLTQRLFVDLPELDFISERSRPDEIDLIAHADREILVGEAKCVDHIGKSVQNRKDAAAKFIRVAQFLHADQIVLVSSGANPWKATSVETLTIAVKRATWHFGPSPKIRLITGISTDNVVDVDANNQPWKSARV